MNLEIDNLFLKMERKKSSPGSVPAKARLKDLCKEDKAKVGELIDKLAFEKRGKSSLEDQVSELKSHIFQLSDEKAVALEDKEKMRKKLEKCMELMKELPRPALVPTVNVYTQTTESYSKSTLTSDYFASTYDDHLFSMVDKIENDFSAPIDSALFKLIKELESSTEY